MAKENKNQTSVTPEEMPVGETVQNPVETEVKQGDVIVEFPEEETPEEETPAGVEIIVVKRFKDKFDHKTLYVAGQELTVDEERADDLVNRGLAKPANT